MKRRILLAITIAWSSLALTKQAGAEQPALVPVTRQEAWQAITAYLSAQGVSEGELPKAGDIELPSAVPAAGQRTLRVAAVCWEAQIERAAFRLECGETGACLAFLVYAGIAPGAFGTLHASQDTKISRACSPGSGARPAKPARAEIAVRPGDRATVVFRGAQLRLSAQVTCVERGAAGDIIRVRNSDGVLFRARVVSAGLLEALSQ